MLNNCKSNTSSPLDRRRKRLSLAIASRVLGFIMEEPKNDSSKSNSGVVDNCSKALLLASLSAFQPDQRYLDALGRSLVLASQNNAKFRSAALFGGLSQLGMAAELTARHISGGTKLLDALDSALNAEAFNMVARVKQSATDGTLRFADYDLISGLTGVAVYLVTRASQGTTPPSLEAVLQTLVDLASTNQRGLFKLVTPKEGITGFYSTRSNFPHGMINCGMAHGLTGVLAVLSIATILGYEVPGIRTGVRTLAEWLKANADYETGIARWPAAVAVTEDGNLASTSGATMDAWCYGSLGILSALLLAGKALSADLYIEFATSTLCEILKERILRPDLNMSPTICHGLSGVLLVVLKFYKETQSKYLKEAAIVIFDQIISKFDAQHQYGFRDIDHNGSAVDDPQLLTGASGVALTLLAAVDPDNSHWTRMLLIA